MDLNLEDQLVVLDFYSDFCAPCKVLMRDLDEISKDYKFTLKKVNIMEQYEMTEKYNVTSVPTLIILKNEEPYNRYTGYKGKEDLRRFLVENTQ